MLHNVPTQINRLVRNVVKNHPNTFNCQVYRKETLRKSDGYFAGKPTMGGIGVIDSGDEEDYEYVYLGNGWALPAEQFQPAAMNDAQDANVGADDDFRFIVVCEKQSSEEGYFEIRNHDVIYVLLGVCPHQAKLAYEVTGLETVTNIAPYTQRYICNRRGDMDVPEWENEANGEGVYQGPDDEDEDEEDEEDED